MPGNILLLRRSKVRLIVGGAAVCRPWAYLRLSDTFPGLHAFYTRFNLPNLC
jgi:hypothetical protein